MKAHVELTARAFAVLESLSESVAFDVFGKLDKLSEFPEMGSPLGPRFPRLKAFRQLIYKRWLRIIDQFDDDDQTVYILAIQDSRQKLPSARDLKRDNRPDEELPLE